MTDAAKPTPGTWYNVCDELGEQYIYSSYNLKRVCRVGYYPDLTADANAELIAEAGNVYHETGLTPRQLLERVRELEADIAEMANGEQK